MRKIIALFFGFTVVTASFAQDMTQQEASELFEQANENYREGSYVLAQQSYQKIEDAGWISAELYFNIGNSFYQQNALAPSIYYYHKSLKLNPNQPAVQSNLERANLGTIDAINDLPLTALQKLDKTYLKALSPEKWAFVAIGISFLFGLFFLLFHFAIQPSKRRSYFVASFLFGFCLILALGITYKELRDAKQDRGAIVFAQSVEVTNAPSSNAQVDFTLHEGTQVQVLDQVDRWRKIRIADGSVGWLVMESIKEY